MPQINQISQPFSGTFKRRVAFQGNGHLRWSILILVLLFSAPVFAQNYCLPIEKARLLVEDAFKKQLMDSVAAERLGKIVRLEDKMAADSKSFETEIASWTEKFASQVLMTDGWRTQAVAATQDAQKFKRQRNTLIWTTIGEALLIVLSVILLAVL